MSGVWAGHGPACYRAFMLSHVDALIEKDGPASKAAGAVAMALYALIGLRAVPDAHWEAVLAVAVLLTLFAPAAMRRDLNKRRAALSGGSQDAKEAA